MDKQFVWGISKWRDFEQCPGMLHAKHITKQWQDAPNDAMRRGSAVHKAFEDAVKYELQLPAELERFNGFVEGVLAMRGQGAIVRPEHKFGVSLDYQNVPYFDGNNLRVRCGLDLYVDSNRELLIVDYKTGRPKQEHEEDAEFYGALTMMTHGALKATVQYLYVDNPGSSFSKKIEDPSVVASNWWKKFEYADKLIASDNVPLTPGNQCSWCGHAACPHNKNRKLQS